MNSSFKKNIKKLCWTNYGTQHVLKQNTPFEQKAIF